MESKLWYSKKRLKHRASKSWTPKKDSLEPNWVRWARSHAVFQAIGSVGLVLAVVSFGLGLQESKKQARESEAGAKMQIEETRIQTEELKRARVYKAWEVIISSEGKTSSAGRIQALQDLTEMKASLAGADLHDAMLSGIDLRKANLDGVNLDSANLTKCNLQGAGLNFAILTGADLTDAHLEGANLRGANLKGADLKGANLKGAYLSFAHLDSANLSKADLDSVVLRYTNLEGGQLWGASLKGADLMGANLKGAYLNSTNLNGANLHEAELESAALTFTHFEGADLRGANLKGACLECAYLQDANLEGAHLEGAIIRGVDFSHTSLSGSKSWTTIDFQGPFNLFGSTGIPAGFPTQGAFQSWADSIGAVFMEREDWEAFIESKCSIGWLKPKSPPSQSKP